MSSNRRTVPGLSATATAATAGAPSQVCALGVREFVWSRGDRGLTTRVRHPPAPGAPDGTPARDAPNADGICPVAEFSHGLGGSVKVE